jgi:hypothetical protein
MKRARDLLLLRENHFEFNTKNIGWRPLPARFIRQMAIHGG